MASEYDKRRVEIADPADLLAPDVKGRCVLAAVGAGGKTTALHYLADLARSKGKKVLLTTTTHMRSEPGLCTCEEEIRRALRTEDYAFAGIPDPQKKGKIQGLPDDMLRRLLTEADVVLIEADGAREKPFKVPYPHEPVLPDYVTRVLVMMGCDAADQRICDACYNPEGVAAALASSEQSLLTLPLMRKALWSGYLNPLLISRPGLPLFVCENPKKGGVLPPGSLGLIRPRVHAIYLAAGFSRRFGANKLLADVSGRPMYAVLLTRLIHILENENLLTDITVVTQYDEIEEALAASPVRVVRNPQPERGISSSMKIGLRAAAGEDCGEEDVFIFFVADQPYLSETTVSDMIRAALCAGAPLAAAASDGVPGNPCLFRGRHREALTAIEGDRGGKALLKAHPEEVLLFETKNVKELEDIDRTC